MSNTHLVSILIAAYNAEQWLSEAVESALEQTYPHLEVVVVDDGSTDGTLAVARRYEASHASVVRVIAQENAGACAARNRALAEAHGEFIKFLDADDVLTPGAVAVQLEYLLPWEQAGRVVPYGELMPTDENLTPKLREVKCQPNGIDRTFSSNLAERVAALLSFNIQTSLPLHRRDWLLDVGGFRSHLKRGQEYDLHLRLALGGVRFLHVPHVVTYLREHAAPHRISNTSPLLSDPSAYLSVQVERRELLEAHLDQPLPPSVIAVLAASIWSHTRRLIQAGELEVARHYVAEAVRLDPNVRHTGRVFRALSMLCGPVRAEQVLMVVRRLLGRT